MVNKTHKSHISEGISVVIPAYNAESWLRPTCEKIEQAIKTAGISNAEIIIVNDGSSDRTVETAEELSKSSQHSYKLLSHENSGRFITRKKGVENAAYDKIFFVDTRVWIDENSLKYVLRQQSEYPERIIWNGHVNVAKKGNIIARFGDAITQIGWRRYFGKPRLTSYGLEDFDYYPKGTGMFLAPKKILLEAIQWFESATSDIRNSSDDTLLIRHMAEQNRIWLSPDFSCTYFARTTLRAFILHSYNRGKFFVDGFLRPGNRFFFPLIGFLVFSAVIVVGVFLRPDALPWLLWILGGVWLMELFVALALRLGPKDAISLFLLSPVFSVVYGLGIWSAVIKRMGVK